ncbi:hypothetical protein ACLBSL_33060, partial [Klebsiella pneumoniae]|uniref:hypothetical protein n=1 Tax=Klebsiella pneumoniae TaxID=573 RepID=UPI003969671D
WIKNNNPHNSIDTEWITKNTIHDVTVRKLDIGEFLKGARLTVTKAPVDVDPLNIMSQYRSVTERYLFLLNRLIMYHISTVYLGDYVLLRP